MASGLLHTGILDVRPCIGCTRADTGTVLKTCSHLDTGCIYHILGFLPLLAPALFLLVPLVFFGTPLDLPAYSLLDLSPQELAMLVL